MRNKIERFLQPWNSSVRSRALVPIRRFPLSRSRAFPVRSHACQASVSESFSSKDEMVDRTESSTSGVQMLRRERKPIRKHESEPPQSHRLYRASRRSRSNEIALFLKRVESGARNYATRWPSLFSAGPPRAAELSRSPNLEQATGREELLATLLPRLSGTVYILSSVAYWRDDASGWFTNLLRES